MGRRRFTKIWESAINRYTSGGFLPGDLVTLKPDFKKHELIKDNESLIGELKALVDSGSNLRITNVKNKYPTAMGGDNTDYKGMEFYVDIAAEMSPGKFGPSYTVPADVLEVIDTTPNLTPIPNKFKYDNKIQIKPKEHKDENEEVPFYTPDGQNKKAYVGNKLQKTDHKLLNKNVTIPSPANKMRKDIAGEQPNYTAVYMQS